MFSIHINYEDQYNTKNKFKVIWTAKVGMNYYAEKSNNTMYLIYIKIFKKIRFPVKIGLILEAKIILIIMRYIKTIT